MSLDVTLTRTYWETTDKVNFIEKEEEVYWGNITHNLNKMAMQAGIYYSLWRPEEKNITKSKQLIPYLTIGLRKLKENPEYYKQFNSPNGWGLYEHFVKFVSEYLDACVSFPESKVTADR